MRDQEAREQIELLLESDHRIAEHMNNLQFAGIWRNCQKCDCETWQKIINRTPAIYYCPQCKSKWKPTIPDEIVEEVPPECTEAIGYPIPKRSEVDDD